MLSERYALDDLIAGGGMASVYRARDEVLARVVAVKVLHPSLAEDEGFLERFRREALAAARLTHPNIVSIYDTGAEPSPEGEKHFIVMEYCGGGTLATLIGSEGPLDPDRVIGVGAAICDALSYAHSNGVVHRDIKPANVLLSEDGTIKVGDFGIAKAAFTEKDLTTSGILLGTVTYVSPEQAQGLEPDHRSDIYSLGVVLYELAAGRPPFAADTPLATAMLHVKEAPPPPRSVRAGIPRDLEDVILSALAKDPDERPASADEMKARLTRGGSGISTAVIPSVRPAPKQAAPEHHGDMSWAVRVVLLVAALVALAFVVSWVLSSDEEPDAIRRGTAGGQGGTTLEITAVDDFDPEGDGTEHATQTQLAVDDDETTSWTTEDYNDGFEGVGKTGVGLIFDLGESADVSSVELVTNTPGIGVELRVADSISDDVNSFTLVDDGSPIESGHSFEVGESGRYWLLWITGLPNGSGTADIAEVRFVGS